MIRSRCAVKERRFGERVSLVRIEWPWQRAAAWSAQKLLIPEGKLLIRSADKLAAMKKALEITLGIVTSIGGFLEMGSIATAIQAGALFGYQLLWAVLLGGLCLIFLVEQAG